MEEKRSLWGFGTREVVYAAIGAALYGVFSWVTNFVGLPAAGNIALRPAVAIPMFFGVAFGPLVGFISGFLGNVLGDFLSGWGFWWYWDLGNGIMGLIPGLMALGITSYKRDRRQHRHRGVLAARGVERHRQRSGPGPHLDGGLRRSRLQIWTLVEAVITGPASGINPIRRHA